MTQDSYANPFIEASAHCSQIANPCRKVLRIRFKIGGIPFGSQHPASWPPMPHCEDTGSATPKGDCPQTSPECRSVLIARLSYERRLLGGQIPRCPTFPQQ